MVIIEQKGEDFSDSDSLGKKVGSFYIANGTGKVM